MKTLIYGCSSVLLLGLLTGCVVEPPRYTHHYPVADSYNNYPEPVYDEPYPYIVNRYYSPVVVRREAIAVSRPVPVYPVRYDHDRPSMNWQHERRDDKATNRNHHFDGSAPQPGQYSTNSPASKYHDGNHPSWQQQRPATANNAQPAQNQAKPNKPQRGRNGWSKKDKQQHD